MPSKPSLSVYSRLALLPRTRRKFYALLPMHAFHALLGLIMMYAAISDGAGGCSFKDKVDVPLSSWIMMIGFMLFAVNATAIAMSEYMIRFVAPENIDVRAGEMHMLDIVFLGLAVPCIAFVLVFFLVGNIWFFWFDWNTAFEGSNRILCRQAVRFGFVTISLLWLSTPICGGCGAYYASQAKKEDMDELKHLLEEDIEGASV